MKNEETKQASAQGHETSVELKPVGIHMYPDGRLNAKSAAAYLGMSEKTLANHRWRGTGPRFIKPGRVFYYLEDLKAWLERACRVVSTAQARLAGAGRA